VQVLRLVISGGPHSNVRRGWSNKRGDRSGGKCSRLRPSVDKKKTKPVSCGGAMVQMKARKRCTALKKNQSIGGAGGKFLPQPAHLNDEVVGPTPKPIITRPTSADFQRFH